MRRLLNTQSRNQPSVEETPADPVNDHFSEENKLLDVPGTPADTYTAVAPQPSDGLFDRIVCLLRTIKVYKYLF